MGQNNKQQNKQSDQEEKRDEKRDIILKAHMHCDACSKQVARCLRGFPGVEDVAVDRANDKVAVKAKGVDPVKVLERLQKKYSRNVELIYPKPKPEKTEKKETEKKKKEEVRTVVLEMFMHCEGCSRDVKKAIEKIKGVSSVETNKDTSKVIVKGVMDPEKLVEKVNKRTGKHAKIVKRGQAGEAEARSNKDNGKHHEENTILFNYPPQYAERFLYPNQNFSDENVYACAVM